MKWDLIIFGLNGVFPSCTGKGKKEMEEERGESKTVCVL